MNTATLSATTAENRRVNLTAIPTLPPARENPGGRVELNGEADLQSPKKNRGPLLKRSALVVLIILAGIGVTKFAYDWWTVGRFIESTDDAYVGGDVTVIAPKVSGFIAQLAVTDNQQVHAGDLLIKLDDRDYRAALAKAGAPPHVQTFLQDVSLRLTSEGRLFRDAKGEESVYSTGHGDTIDALRTEAQARWHNQSIAEAMIADAIERAGGARSYVPA